MKLTRLMLFENYTSILLKYLNAAALLMRKAIDRVSWHLNFPSSCFDINDSTRA
jgi:hypothetical protein